MDFPTANGSQKVIKKTRVRWPRLWLLMERRRKPRKVPLGPNHAVSGYAVFYSVFGYGFLVYDDCLVV